ncbi:MAG: FtsH protease activity modulator HflK [Proteobacteria bacterium]|nr:MAG: FtsH protease activity modulator HflK [Pseudomonadota bacterium]
MARSGDPSPDERVRRSVARTLANVTLLAASLGVLAAWAYFGFYQLEPGQAAVILRFGEYVRTESDPGLRWHLPPPIEDHEVVNVASIDKEEFGTRGAGADSPTAAAERAEASMQTSDNNIVHVGFVVQYRIKDAFASRYRVADPREILRDAAQSAVRGVVGRHSIDGVLSSERGAVEAESEELLQEALDHYESGLEVIGIELQDVSPPPDVRSAFDDVLAAIQDRNRAVNEAEGYANEVLPTARAQAIEAVESARGYRDAKIAEASGEAARFRAIAAEYARAPDVVRTRLFLETMEQVLPDVRTVIVEPGTAVMPYLPLDPLRAAEGAR